MKFLSPAILVVVLSVGVNAAGQENKKDDPSQIGDRDVGKCLNFYPIDKEMAWGKQLSQEVARESKISDDPILTEFVNRVGQNLARNSDAKVPFTFHVIEGEEVNAFALPGGYVYVYTGLIKLASDEDEFAAALAHEIAHVAARHMTCQASKAQVAKAASVIPGIFLGGLGGYATREAANAVLPMSFRSFSRHDESEADYLGVQYMYAAGYDPTGAVSIFEKLASIQKTKPSGFAKLFASHPQNSDRIDKTEQEIQRILPAKPEYVVTTSEYRAVRERLLAQESLRKSGDKEGRPVLLKKPTGDNGDDPTSTPGDEPTIKRRDLID
jgi:beta-barrel assembly-enhancing protease